MSESKFNRRRFLQLSALGAGGALLAACAAPAAAPGAASSAAATTAPAAAAAAGSEAAAGTSALEIFSWWTAGGEVEALNALYEIFSAEYPDVEIQNAALAGGAGQGGNMKALLETRMMGGQPPDSFQVHLGRELIDSHVIPGRMEPLDWLYEEEGFNEVFPQDLIDIASYDGKPWSVPVNIHRSNVLWYRTDKFEQVGVEPPTTWDEFFTVAEAFKAAGIPALMAAELEPNHAGHMFESVLNAVLDPDQYRGLFNGSTSWEDPGVTEALEILNRAYDYANPDYLSTSPVDQWDRYVADDGPAMIINGDWAHGVFISKEFSSYHWTPSPGTSGKYIVLSDSFGLPVDAPHRDNAIAFLKICGSKAGQDAFNPVKGSIPARTDPDLSLYDEYLLSAMEDFAANTLVPSIQHGAAAKQSFVLDYAIALNVLASTRDVAQSQADLVRAAEDAEFVA
jgi:glucose/mannose transport system substrate-binding protein